MALGKSPIAAYIFANNTLFPLPSISPDIVPPDNGNLLAIELVIVVLKFASSPNAAANSFKVLSVPGALSTKFAIAVSISDCVTEPALVILASTLASV